MASKFLLTMKLTKQGDVIGSSKGREGDLDFSTGMACHGFQYGIGGSASGNRQHKPITITREIDSASPVLWQALSTSEVFTSAELSFDRIGPDGKPSGVRTIGLVNGNIIKIRGANAPSGAPSGKRFEAVTLIFERLLVDQIPHGRVPFMNGWQV